MNIILGGGLAGLSCSYHLGHEKCSIIEKQDSAFGHIKSTKLAGFTWDQGPHVSFTRSEYVRNLFSESVSGEFEDYSVKVSNYFRGTWIDHPAQANLYQVPEPLRSRCIQSFLMAQKGENESTGEPANYLEWLKFSFGEVFAEAFPAAYTRKYWTCEPQKLTTDWVGARVFKPNVDDVLDGAKGPLSRPTHYITRIRYPKAGGFQSFAKLIAREARIVLGTLVERIDLKRKCLWVRSGRKYVWERLVNTLPLPEFVNCCVDAPTSVREAAKELVCSQLYLVNVMARHSTLRDANWMYVYDEDKLSTRISCTEKLTAHNAPPGCTGVQVEVYHSRFRPMVDSELYIKNKVIEELREMGLIERDASVESNIVKVDWANVIFTHDTKAALNAILEWLERFGLERESDDLSPMTDWSSASPLDSTLVMAGRFGQWKYFWTDDCVLRGKQLAMP